RRGRGGRDLDVPGEGRQVRVVADVPVDGQGEVGRGARRHLRETVHAEEETIAETDGGDGDELADAAALRGWDGRLGGDVGVGGDPARGTETQETRHQSGQSVSTHVRPALTIQVVPAAVPAKMPIKAPGGTIRAPSTGSVVA